MGPLYFLRLADAPRLTHISMLPLPRIDSHLRNTHATTGKRKKQKNYARKLPTITQIDFTSLHLLLCA